MQASLFEEQSFFRSIAESNARALLIGRQALIALGLPVLTRDYDFWVHPDDTEQFNEAAQPFGLVPSRSPREARAVGRYVLENDEHVDVLVARGVSTVDGQLITFDEVWARRRELDLGNGVSVSIPSIPDLISTKRFGARARDAEDIRLLQALLAEEDK